LLQRNNESDSHKETSAIIFWCHYLWKVTVPLILKILSGQPASSPFYHRREETRYFGIRPQNEVKCGGFWKERERERHQLFCRRIVGINVNRVTDGRDIALHVRVMLQGAVTARFIVMYVVTLDHPARLSVCLLPRMTLAVNQRELWGQKLQEK
jgi:hypothetical protein